MHSHSPVSKLQILVVTDSDNTYYWWHLETSLTCSCYSSFNSFILYSSSKLTLSFCTDPTFGYLYAYYYANYKVLHLQKLTLVLSDSFFPKDPCRFWNMGLHKHHNAIHMQNVIEILHLKDNQNLLISFISKNIHTSH